MAWFFFWAVIAGQEAISWVPGGCGPAGSGYGGRGQGSKDGRGGEGHGLHPFPDSLGSVCRALPHVAASQCCQLLRQNGVIDLRRQASQRIPVPVSVWLFMS